MDNSPHSIDAAKRAIELQKQYGAEVVAFHSIKHHLAPKVLSAFNSFFYTTTTSTIPNYLEIEGNSIAQGKNILGKIKDIFEREGGQLETRLINHTTPKHYIEKTVISEEFDLVILGCKGEHSKVGELVLGSVAHDAVNHARCDVLIVR